MKVTRDITKNESVYPYCGIAEIDDDQYIVLFNRNQSGMIIWSNCKDRHVGYYSTTWVEKEFKHWNGTLHFRN
jgi:hypothetical protein